MITVVRASGRGVAEAGGRRSARRGSWATRHRRGRRMIQQPGEVLGPVDQGCHPVVLGPRFAPRRGPIDVGVGVPPLVTPARTRPHASPSRPSPRGDGRPRPPTSRRRRSPCASATRLQGHRRRAGERSGPRSWVTPLAPRASTTSSQSRSPTGGPAPTSPSSKPTSSRSPPPTANARSSRTRQLSVPASDSPGAASPMRRERPSPCRRSGAVG